MEGVTYKVLEANGRNLLVEYTCQGQSVQVGVRVPDGADEARLKAVIASYTPNMYFEEVLNPVAPDAFSGLVGLEGEVPSPVTVAAPPVTMDNLVTFKDVS